VADAPVLPNPAGRKILMLKSSRGQVAADLH